MTSQIDKDIAEHIVEEKIMPMHRALVFIANNSSERLIVAIAKRGLDGTVWAEENK